MPQPSEQDQSGSDGTAARAGGVTGASARGLGIRAKMILVIAVPTLVVYLTVLGLTLARLSASNREEVQRSVEERAESYADRFDGAFERAAAVALTTARMMETVPGLTEQQIYAQLRANVLQDESIYGRGDGVRAGDVSDRRLAVLAVCASQPDRGIGGRGG